MADIRLNERSWLAWLVKVRVIIISFLLAVELLIVNLTPNNVPTRLFIDIVLTWYTVSLFFAILHYLWADYKLQALTQIFTDLAFSTAVVYVTGGIDTFFNFLYPLVIIVASILLPRYWAYVTSAVAFVLFGAVIELTYFDKIRSFQTSARGDVKSLQAVLLVNFFAYLAVAYLASSLTAKLRQAGTELRSKSGELENLQALHANVVHSIRSGLLTTDLNGRVTLINAPGQRLLQRTASEVYGRHVAELFTDRLPKLQSSAAQGEVRGMTPVGDEKIFGITVTPLSVPEQGAIGHVYTFEDHTEIRRLEREVRMRDRLAAVGRLAAGIAHEIRNPLASIAGSVQMLARISGLNDEQKQLLDIVTRESNRLNSIITDFLAYSREKSFKFARVDLIPLVNDALILLEHRLNSRDLKVVRHFSAAEAYAVVDSDRIKQVFWNLLENAARAMEHKGTITVSVKSMEDMWQVSFRDTGSGIQPNLLDKIFEPFQSSFEGGTGLGLAIVYQIVQAHGAKIRVQSQPGQGAEFVFEILHAKASGPEEPMAEAAVVAQAGSEAAHG
ncbi:MAG TPA: ATP-binding protein [Candidatus Saccharimonadales bacterium]|jgi:two-component system sensor histidine kinase PilS (NtrC family)|nr:ATP-binding protein [Candidatus Saccharimonadales bacterium]